MVCSLVSIYFDSSKLGIKQKRFYKTLDHWSRDMFNFDFWNSFSTTFCAWFSKKNVSHAISINWPYFIFWLLFSLWYWAICALKLVASQVGCDVINFDVNIILIIKPFLYKTRKSRQFKYLENEKSFQGEIKRVFHHL